VEAFALGAEDAEELPRPARRRAFLRFHTRLDRGLEAIVVRESKVGEGQAAGPTLRR
jgi:hypothetical protein